MHFKNSTTHQIIQLWGEYEKDSHLWYEYSVPNLEDQRAQSRSRTRVLTAQNPK